MKKLLGLGAALASVLAASSAMAQVTTYTFTGTLSNTYDPGGIFAPANALNSQDDGLSYTAIFSVDPSNGSANGDPFAGGTLLGGSGFGPPQPTPVTATLTVNGTTLSFNGGYYSSFSQNNNTQNLFLNTIASIAPNVSIIQQINNGLLYGGGFSSYSVPSGFPIGLTGDLNPISYTSSSPSVSAAPEPSIWGLTLLAVGLIGLTLRYRRRVRGAIGLAGFPDTASAIAG